MCDVMASFGIGGALVKTLRLLTVRCKLAHSVRRSLTGRLQRWVAATPGCHLPFSIHGVCWQILCAVSC